LIVAIACAPARAHAQSAEHEARPRTPPSADAPRVTFAAAVFVGLGVVLSLGDPMPAPRWAGNPFDDAIRDGLRLHDADARRAIALSSDLLVAGLVAFEVIADGLVVPLVGDGPDLAWQSTAAYALVLGVTLTLDELVKYTTARARPIELGCDTDPTLPQCTVRSPGMSFYSGHAAIGFASAGFSCAMHLHHALFGDVAADGATCGTSLLAAAVVGLFRVVADQHHFTDVLVGAAVGFATGYLVPLFLVPPRPTRATTGPVVVVLPTAGPQSMGLAASGSF
jgi:membrane-associated phospholipid phosphatase